MVFFSINRVLPTVVCGFKKVIHAETDDPRSADHDDVAYPVENDKELIKKNKKIDRRKLQNCAVDQRADSEKKNH